MRRFFRLGSVRIKDASNWELECCSTYYSIGLTTEKQTGKHREKKVVDVLGIECAKKFWEVVNGTR